MKNFRIGFEKDSGIVPWLIRKLTGFSYNHVLITFESEEWQEEWVFESVRSGVRTIPLSPTRKPKVRDRFLVKKDLSAGLRSLQDLLAQPYDLLGLFLFGVRIILMDLFKVRASFSGVTLKGQHCSELIARVLGQEFQEDFKDPQWTNPKDIYNFILDHPQDFTRG